MVLLNAAFTMANFLSESFSLMPYSFIFALKPTTITRRVLARFSDRKRALFSDSVLANQKGEFS